MLSAQPTPLEVPVTIQGATPVGGSDRRELFTETTKTTLTFENGAVVSLKAKVAPGQCLFLRNEQSGREILCRVLEYRQGGPVCYTDLEFTSRDPGFWEAPAPKPTAIAQNQNNGAQASVPPATENHVAALKHESLAAIGDEAPANVLSAAATEPAAASSASTGATPQPADDADWNEAKDAELMAALARMAGDAKPKPKPESVAQGKQAKGQEAASEKASQPDEGGSDAAVQSNVISVLTSVPGRIAVAGIAASVLIAAMLGLSWHAKRNASLNATPHSVASAQPAASQTSQAPTAPAATSGAATTNTAPAISNETTPANSNVRTTPPQTADKTQQPAVVQASGDPSAPSKNNPDGPVVVEEQPIHPKPKEANTSVGETIPARIISQAPPAIPSWAKGLDLDPVVQLDAVIDANGNLKATKALSGPRILQGAAKRAVALWIFEPALTDGKPTTTHMVLTVEFQR